MGFSRSRHTDGVKPASNVSNYELDDGVVGAADHDALDMRKLGVRQETKVRIRPSSFQLSLIRLSASLWIVDDARFHGDHDVHLGVGHTVRTVRSGESVTAVLTPDSFFTTAFLNGGGVSMIYGSVSYTHLTLPTKRIV